MDYKFFLEDSNPAQDQRLFSNEQVNTHEDLDEIEKMS